MSGVLADLKHAIRIYLGTPGSSLLAIGVLAIAMACVSSFLSLFSDLALKGHPGFERSGELVTIGRNDGTNFMPLSRNAIVRIGEEVTALGSITGTAASGLELDPGGEQPVEYVARGFFDTMRPRVELGRGFDEADHQADAEPVTIISHTYWLEHFGGRPDTIGQTVRLTGTPFMFRFDPDAEPPSPEEQTVSYRIVGVMDQSYASTFGGFLPTAAWLPFEQAAPIFIGGASDTGSLLFAFARPDDSARLGALATELNDRYGGMGQELGMPPGIRLELMRGIVRDANVRRDVERQVRLLLVGGVLLALAAAANVSLFLLSRAPGRRRELGVRMSVGAPTRRLARQLATEAGLLVVVSAALGLLIGAWLNVLLKNLSFLRAAQWRDVSLDWRVLALVCGMTLILTGLVSLGPVLGLRRLGLAASSRAVSARPGLTQHVAGNVQIAAACLLAGVAGAFSWYLGTLIAGNRGYDTRDIYVVSSMQRPGFFNFRDIDYDGLLAERNRRREAVLALPGVEAVAFGTSVPGRLGFRISARFPKQDGSDGEIGFTVVSCDPGYTDLLGMRIEDGRALTEADRNGMLVNETFAREMWGRADVVGEVFPGGFGGSEQTEIVGVLEDVSFGHPSADVLPLAFIYLTPFSNQESLLIRTRLSSAELRQSLQGAIDAGALEMEIGDVESLSDIAGALIAADQARSGVAVATALLVVALAAFGFYGTQRFLVASGRREFAIRAALGAGPRAIGRLVLGRALLLGAPGLAFGSVLAFIAVAWMRPDFVPDSISPMAVTLAVLAAMAALLVGSTLGPAKLARDTDPGPLLKQD